VIRRLLVIATPNIIVTPTAQEHFALLIEKEEMPGMGLRIFLTQPGLPMADVSISFCPPGEHRAGDIPINFGVFTLFVDKTSASYLENAEIDYKKDGLGGQLAITAPNLRDPKPKDDASIADRVNFILQAEINPSLASHGGMVTLIEVTDNNEVVLRFGGGCHGCGMADVTLKQGIEKSLMSQIPEVTAVLDVTDHSKGENPYYAT
jgi:Fe/S biogenesis protein NfuA